MAEGYPKSVNYAIGAVLGGALLSGCGAAKESIDCAKQPGKSISVEVDSTEISDPANPAQLAVVGHKVYSIVVSRTVSADGQPRPNNISMHGDDSPAGRGGTEEEIDSAGPQGITLFTRPPGPDIAPPYYISKAVGDPGSHAVTFTLTCDSNQSPR